MTTTALQTLLQHAEQQRDEGLAALAGAEDFAARMAAQTQQLLAYRDDYRQRHPARDGRSATIELLRSHEGFMQRLDQAIAQQQNQQQQAESGVRQQRATVLELQTRAAAVKKLIERRQAEQRQLELRLDQRRSDEAFRRRSGDEQALQRRWSNTGHAPTGWQQTTQAVPL
jgi:flagellar FliJ protein